MPGRQTIFSIRGSVPTLYFWYFFKDIILRHGGIVARATLSLVTELAPPPKRGLDFLVTAACSPADVASRPVVLPETNSTHPTKDRGRLRTVPDVRTYMLRLSEGRELRPQTALGAARNARVCYCAAYNSLKALKVTPDPILRSPADRLALNQFRELAQAWAPFFRTELRVAVALRDRADNWHLVFGITGFAPEQTTPLTALEVRTASIRAYRRIRHFDSTEAITAVRQTLQRPGVAEFSDIEASLAQPENQVITFERNFVARRAGPIRSPALVIGKDLASIQASAFPPTEQLDHELLTFEKPFDGLVDLLTDLAVPEVNQILSSSRAEIILFPPAGLHFAPAGQPLTKGTCLQQGKLNIVVSAHPKVRRDKLRIGAKLFPSTPPATRSSYVLPDDSWTESGDHIEGRLELEASDVPLAFAVLSYDGEFLGKWWIRDFDLSFNDRLQIHRSVDQASMLQSTFFDDRTDFEDRVNLLLALLGLQTLKYGQIPKLTEAPDILALSAGRHLYVIECTVGDIDRKGKLHRLYDRANQIREHLSRSSQPPMAVQPVIFTSLTRQETASHWSTAATYRIALVCRENILSLLNFVDSPPTAEELYFAAVAAIPSSGTASPEAS